MEPRMPERMEILGVLARIPMRQVGRIHTLLMRTFTVVLQLQEAAVELCLLTQHLVMVQDMITRILRVLCQTTVPEHQGLRPLLVQPTVQMTRYSLEWHIFRKNRREK